jgi:hypothetical protein
MNKKNPSQTFALAESSFEDTSPYILAASVSHPSSNRPADLQGSAKNRPFSTAKLFSGYDDALNLRDLLPYLDEEPSVEIKGVASENLTNFAQTSPQFYRMASVISPIGPTWRVQFPCYPPSGIMPSGVLVSGVPCPSGVPSGFPCPDGSANIFF